MKIYCRQTGWCKEIFEVEEKDFFVKEKIELDEFGKVLKRGFLDHWREFEKRKHKIFYVICPNCKHKTEIKNEFGEVVGTGRVYYGD